MSASQAARRRICAQCKRLRFIPLHLHGKPNEDGYCTESCQRAAVQAGQPTA